MIYVSGDTHGEVSAYRKIMDAIPNPTAEDIIIICGDASLEYGEYSMGSCRKAMSKFPGSWIIMRGNHDNRYWEAHTQYDSQKKITIADKGWDFSDKFDEITLYQNKYPNIHYIDDMGGLYNIDGYGIMFYPGAYSVDKEYRIAFNKPYAWNEQCTNLEFEYLNEFTMKHIDDIDFVISHTCPISAEPMIQYLFMKGLDQSKIDKATEKWLDKYYNHLKNSKNFKHWFFGHFHDDKELSEDFTIVYNKVVRLENYV